MKTEIV